MYDVALKKAYKTAFDFIMPHPAVTKNKPGHNLRHTRIAAQTTQNCAAHNLTPT
jgi:hypothetical protein